MTTFSWLGGARVPTGWYTDALGFVVQDLFNFASGLTRQLFTFTVMLAVVLGSLLVATALGYVLAVGSTGVVGAWP